MTVDHAERRRRIAEATAAVAAREGLDAATIRRIAAELGGPTKTVTYYFADKQELLLFTYEFLAQQYLEEAAAGARDGADLLGALTAMTATDERSRVRWRFYLAFGDRAARCTQFAELQRRNMDQALAHIGGLLSAHGMAEADIEDASLLLNALVQGISAQALADPSRWPADRVRRVLSAQAERLLAGRRGAAVQPA
jgi:AcrR family transcriptional regulator